MKPFPGPIRYEYINYHHQIVLTDEQEKWLTKWFPITEGRRIAATMNISISKLYNFVRKLGLKKSNAGMKAIKRRQTKAMVKANNKNGCYDRKRGHKPSEATLEGARRRWREYRAGLREHPFQTIKREDPERYHALMIKRSQNRRELIEKDKRRVVYGLPRKTKIRFAMKPYTRSQESHRYSALKRGYLLDEDCSEGQPGRYTIYYDDETERNEEFERNCIADGFTIEKDEQ